MKLSSKDATLIPTMAVASALSHMAIGPLVNRTFHVPGPTLAGLVIMVPTLGGWRYHFQKRTNLDNKYVEWGNIVSICSNRRFGNSHLCHSRSNP